jgi:hypothetical protein
MWNDGRYEVIPANVGIGTMNDERRNVFPSRRRGNSTREGGARDVD